MSQLVVDTNIFSKAEIDGEIKYSPPFGTTNKLGNSIFSLRLLELIPEIER